MVTATIRFTDKSDGSFALGDDHHMVEARRRAVIDAPVTWLRQVHGATCVEVGSPGEQSGIEADAAMTTVPGVVLSAITADCAPVVLTSSNAVAAVHAGWRGLVAGVLPATVAAMRRAGATEIAATLGPCIRSRCYEFGSDELDQAAAVLGDVVRGETAWGTPALDVAAGVRSSLAMVGVTELIDTSICTACSSNHWSFRARSDTGRQAAMVWLEQ